MGLQGTTGLKGCDRMDLIEILKFLKDLGSQSRDVQWIYNFAKEVVKHLNLIYARLRILFIWNFVSSLIILWLVYRQVTLSKKLKGLMGITRPQTESEVKMRVG